MKIKNFLIWLAWLEHKDTTRSTIIIYGLIITVFILVFFPSWLISGNSLTAVKIGLVFSFALVMSADFISSCFFSNAKKNWKIAISEALDITNKHFLYCLDCPEYAKKMAVLIGELRKTRNKNPEALNNFVKSYRDLFEAKKALIVMNDEQTKLCNQIVEAKGKIREF